MTMPAASLHRARNSGSPRRDGRTVAAAVLVAAIATVAWSTAAAQATVCSTCHIYAGRHTADSHQHGVGNCDMCHVMHNSLDGEPANPTGFGNEMLLLRDTASDVCLMCHAGEMGNVFGGNPAQPPTEVGAGNFGFLAAPNLNDAPGGATHPIAGHHAGHSIVARSFNVTADPVLGVAPGGSFPAASLGCTSCHDPHGNQNYRMLYGPGPVQGGLYVFTQPAPDADGLSVYHGRERPNRHTAYRSGFSAWCANCHLEIHDQGGIALVHPVDVSLGTEMAAVYNAYNGSADLAGGDLQTAYLPEVPIESQDATTDGTRGATADSRVMCLTCHRAHASSAPDAGRWDFNLTFLAADGEASGSYPLPNPFGDAGQRSLCNKCHAKDAFDETPVDPTP